MKPQRVVPNVAAAFLASAGTAYAADGWDVTGGVFIWVFLGFCALIVVGQLVPAVMILIGLAKGVASPPERDNQLQSK